MADDTVLTDAYMPASTSMDNPGGTALAPDFEGSVPEDRGVISQRIMDDSIAYEYPNVGQGNLEPIGNGSAKGS